jgi:energy-converting hydrogenase A subunit M
VERKGKVVMAKARATGTEALERKIEKAKSEVAGAKLRYEKSVAELKDLLDKRDALRRDELVKAIAKSDKSYDDILRYLRSGGSEE